MTPHRFRTARPSPAPARRPHLGLVALEDRTTPATFAWNVDADGNWNDPANWKLVSGTAGPGFPNAADDIARFGNVITADRTVTIPDGVTITVGEIRFDDGNDYTVAAAGTGKLVLDVATGEAAVTVTSANGNGAHEIKAPVALNDPVAISTESTGALTFSGVLSGTGGVSIEGPEIVLFVATADNTYAGGTAVNDGTLVLDATAAAVVLPGDVTVGDGTGAAMSAILLVTAADSIADAADVTVNSDGALGLGPGVMVTVNDLTLNPGGAVTPNTGKLTANGTFAVNGTAGNDTFTITGTAADFAVTLNGQKIAGVTVGGTAHLNGLDGNDTFTFADGKGFKGAIDGGAGTDTLDYAAATTAVSVNLGTTVTGDTFTATLGADQEVPSTTSTATGTGTVKYNLAAGTIDVSVSVQGIAPADVTGFHIHREAFGVNGSIIIDFGGNTKITPDGTGFKFEQAGIPVPAGNEAALLGGLTYINVHTQTNKGGEIRGQLFAGNVFTDAAGSATGTTGVSNVENATGGAGDDSLVGSGLANVLTGGGGNDTVVGARGNDTVSGAAGDDAMVWSNGDNNDVFDGNAGNDRVQVNGSVDKGDAFTIGANGTRVAFQRTNLVPFTIDIGTAETLTVIGVGGDDTFTQKSLTGVADLAALNLAGLDGNDTFTFADGAGFKGTLDGGNGTDTADYSAYTTGVSVNLGTTVTGNTFTATLGGDQALPPTASAATGTGTITYNAVAKSLDLSASVQNLDPTTVTGVRLQAGPFGTTGPVITDIPLSGLVADGTGFKLTMAGILVGGSEAALLGGLTNLVVFTKANPAGEVRGQFFAGNVFTAAAGSATGGVALARVENATGGGGSDSLVGTPAANVLQGNGGNDTVIGGQGNDTVSGGAGDDVMVWSNGDNTDVFDGDAGNDRVQVNGSVDKGDAFAITPIGTRVNFQRTNLVPFAINIGTTETLTVIGVGGDDTFNAANLVGVADLTALNLAGLDGNDTFTVTPSKGVAITVAGGGPAGATGDTLALNASGTTGGRQTTTTDATGISGSVTFADRGTVSFSRLEAANVTGLSGSPFAVGKGSGNAVQVRDPDGTSADEFAPFDATFTGGVRVATADFNNDGVLDTVVGTGPGAATRVRVISGADNTTELFAVSPFEASFLGGVYVAAGDVTGDGRPDLIITPDEGGGPRVRVFSGSGFGQVDDFFGIEDTAFRGGARAAVGDVNGDGRGDLVVAAGFGGGPRIAVFSGTGIGTGSATRPKLFGDFFVFENSLRNGAFVAAGDTDGDGKADLVAGGGPGGGPRVRVLSGAALIASPSKQTELANFFAGDTNNRGGVRVATGNLDADARADLITGAGTGGGSRVTGYAGKALTPTGTPAELFGQDAFAGFTGGVFVG